MEIIAGQTFTDLSNYHRPSSIEIGPLKRTDPEKSAQLSMVLSRRKV